MMRLPGKERVWRYLYYQFPCNKHECNGRTQAVDDITALYFTPHGKTLTACHADYARQIRQHKTAHVMYG